MSRVKHSTYQITKLEAHLSEETKAKENLTIVSLWEKEQKELLQKLISQIYSSV